MQQAIEHRDQRHSRHMLLLLALIFAAPPLAGWLLVLNPQWLPEGRAHHGQLIQPTRSVTALRLTQANGKPLDWQRLSGQWLLLGYQPGDCGNPCQQRQQELAQVERALGANRKRVVRLLIGGDTTTATLPSNTLRLTLPASQQTLFKQTFQPERGASYLIDPFGQLVMRYPADSAARDIMQDLELLLEASASWGKG